MAFEAHGGREREVQAEVSPQAPCEVKMEILSEFDSGVRPDWERTDTGIRFDLRPGQRILNVLVTEISGEIQVEILVDEKGEGFLRRQGLLVSDDGESFRPVPLETAGDGVLSAHVSADGGEVRLASRYPYGRDSLEKLICETAGNQSLSWRFLRAGHRGFPLAEFGEDDGEKTVHYFIAGEDAWETAGCWVADEMVRELCRNQELACRLWGECVVRIVPAASPHSGTADRASYCTLEGKGIYGAATWGDAEPPPEYAILRKLVEESIRERRLGYMMTMHSWQAQHESSGLQTIKSAGDKVLSDARQAWAAEVMATMIDRVPQGQVSFPQKIWHPGLARDYLLAEHNAITFRVEVTTAGVGAEMFRETGRRFLSNVSRIRSWEPVLRDT